MIAVIKGVWRQALVLGLLAFALMEVFLNFTFHWLTVQDEVFGGLGLPEHFHLVVPAGFVGWAMFFLLGADRRALENSLIAAAVGCLLGAMLIVFGSETADAPDFWGLALWAAVAVVILAVLAGIDAARFAPAPAFLALASVFFWWVATGLDYYVPGAKGPHTVDALAAASTDRPLAAGLGAFGGLLSMPWEWVVISTFVSIAIGVLVGLVAVKGTVWVTRLTSRQGSPYVSHGG